MLTKPDVLPRRIFEIGERCFSPLALVGMDKAQHTNVLVSTLPEGQEVLLNEIRLAIS